MVLPITNEAKMTTGITAVRFVSENKENRRGAD